MNWLNPLGADPKAIAAELERIDPRIKPTPAEGQQAMDAILFHPETSMRRALILALGTYGTEGLSPGEREPLTAKLLDLYRNDPDAGIHGAAEWTLRQWKQREKLKAADAELMTLKDAGRPPLVRERPGADLRRDRRPGRIPDGLAADRTGTRMRTKRPTGFASPAGSPSPPRRCRSSSIRGSCRTNPDFDVAQNYRDKYSPDPERADDRRHLVWCRRLLQLAERAGRIAARTSGATSPPRRRALRQGMTIPADVLRRIGYRLPTEAEWEYACRSGTITSRYHGLRPACWGPMPGIRPTARNTPGSCGSLLPNDLGLFDMLGNVYEWCQDKHRPYRVAEEKCIFDDINTLEQINENPRLLRGGSFDNRPSIVRSADRTGTPRRTATPTSASAPPGPIPRFL